MYLERNLGWLCFVTVLAAVGCSSDAERTESSSAVSTLVELCDEVAERACACSSDAELAECVEEVRSDCNQNAAQRDPGGYTVDKGEACLRSLEQLDCSALPLNCEQNLATAECNDYLDGRTNGVDPACPE